MTKRIPKPADTFGRTKNVEAFIKANDQHNVVSGAAFKGGGGNYTLSNGESFTFTLNEARSMPAGYPNWGFWKA